MLKQTVEWRIVLYCTRGWIFRVGVSFHRFPFAPFVSDHWLRRRLFQGLKREKLSRPVADLQLPDRR